LGILQQGVPRPHAVSRAEAVLGLVPNRREFDHILIAMTTPEVDVHSDIAAPVGKVWQLVTDIVLMPRFSSELKSAAWAEGFDGPQLGAQFLGTNENPAVGVWTTRSHIIEFEPPHVFGWAVGDPARPAAVWRFELTPTTGGTRLRYSASIGPGKSGVTMMIDREPDRAQEIVQLRLRQFVTAMEATVAGITKLAESA
jgi:uncharacterized protein YndB with AHSA1/START domain